MGKKRVIAKGEQEVLAEKDKIDQKLRKEAKLKSVSQTGRGRVYISSSYNNTILTLTGTAGDVLLWKSAGSIGFKGTKKGTSYAASQVAQALAQGARQMKIREVDVFVKGIGGGRSMALKSLANQGLEILTVKDITPIPHNGCRPRKPRRV